METIYISVQAVETGRHIRGLMNQQGFTVKDIQTAMGFENPQAVYKWLSGRSLPSLDNLVVLSRVLHTGIDDILVVGGDFCLYGVLNQRMNDFLIAC